MDVVGDRAGFLADIVRCRRRETEVQGSRRKHWLVKRCRGGEDIEIVYIVDIGIDIGLAVNIAEDLTEVVSRQVSINHLDGAVRRSAAYFLQNRPHHRDGCATVRASGIRHGERCCDIGNVHRRQRLHDHRRSAVDHVLCADGGFRIVAAALH